MRHQYACDIGDFAKYSLLNALAERDFRLAVIWYLNASEENNFDGNFTEYAELRGCDERLYAVLQDLLKAGNRSLAAIERSGTLPPNTTFFSVPLPANPQRQGWLSEAAEASAMADIVFLDPDNGLAESPDSYRRSPRKYASIAEVVCFLRRNQTVVIYQHQTRSGSFDEQLERHCNTIRSMGAPVVWVFTFHRRSSRAFIVVPAARHAQTLEQRCCGFIQSAWGRESHFRLKMHSPQARVSEPLMSTARHTPVKSEKVPRSAPRENKRTTDPGYVNRNGQQVVRATDLAGTDYGQRVYVLRCGSCSRDYGANGSDVFQRRCPWCQRGKPGLPFGR